MDRYPAEDVVARVLALAAQTDPMLRQLDRLVALARQVRVTKGRKLRLDGTVVQTTIHHPTDSSLLVDWVRVLSRVLRRSKPLVGERAFAAFEQVRCPSWYASSSR